MLSRLPKERFESLATRKLELNWVEVELNRVEAELNWVEVEINRLEVEMLVEVNWAACLQPPPPLSSWEEQKLINLSSINFSSFDEGSLLTTSHFNV